MRYKILYIFLLLTISACNTTNSKGETEKANRVERLEPNYDVALQFINDYLDYCNNHNSRIGLIEWITVRSDVSDGFKKELKIILSKAERDNPDFGLGFDPILDAQDNPNQFEIDLMESEFLVVMGEKWPEFRLTLKLKEEGDKWLVDGSGIINVPEEKRMKR